MRHPYVLLSTRCLLVLASLLATAAGQEKLIHRTGGPTPEEVSKKPESERASRKAKKNPKEDKGSAKKARGQKRGQKKAAPKRPLAPADYAQWESLDLQNRKFSNDGRWLVYSISRVDQERTLFLHRLKGINPREETTYKHGERPVFSNDSKWLAVTIGKSPAEIEKAKKAGSKAPPSPGATLHLRRLKDGETTEFANVQGLSFSDDSRFAALEVMGKPTTSGGSSRPGSTATAAKSAGPGKALLVRTLADGSDTTFGNVVKYAWSDQGSLLAMVVDSPSISNSLQLYDPARGVLKTLESSDQEYATLQWREDSFDLGALREMKHGEKEDVSHVLLAWRDLDQSAPRHFQLDHAKLRSFPGEKYLAAGIEWSKDGAGLFCNLKNWEKKPKDFPVLEPAEKQDKPAKNKRQKKSRKKNKNGGGNETKTAAPDAEENKEAGADQPEKQESATNGTKKEEQKTPARKTLRESLETPSNVEIWHSKDAEIMPRQKKEAASKKNPDRRAVWWLKRGEIVQLATELTESVTILGNGQQALGRDRTPHERTAMFGPHLEDVYLIHTTTGKRQRILEGNKYTLSSSPDGQYVLFLQDGQIWSHQVTNGKQRNLTGKLETDFTNQEDDTLAVEKRPYSSGTWLKDSSAVLLYDRFDLWLVAPNGTQAVRLTDGAKDEVRHRISQASFREEDDGHLDPANPLYVALYGERTKKSGYGRLALSSNPSSLKTLLWDDQMILSLERARDAEVFSFTRERTDLPRDLYLAGPGLSPAHQVTNLNAFQKDFLWGRSELIDYTNKHGVQLQGALTYPAGYQPGRKYPMIVYIYEKRSQELHRYITPTEKHPYNPTVFSSEGYFLFQPDIVYRPQEPGLSAVECVVPAVEKVLQTGMIDPERVGLMGHSWGAYQTSFIVTQTDLFAAGVAGAPLTDLLSMSVSVYWNSGNPNAWIFSQSQGRMDKPFWRDVDTYVRNSPIHGLDTLNTPLLIAFGDKDGAVDWDQGIQMYNAARWAGKEDVVMLVYPGENHGLRKDENRVDYHYRVKEWFDHYLMGGEARKWITEGKSFLEREKEIEALKEKKEASKKPAPPAKAADKKNSEGKVDIQKKPKSDSPPTRKGRKGKKAGQRRKPARTDSE